jgi:hypothetical protein
MAATVGGLYDFMAEIYDEVKKIERKKIKPKKKRGGKRGRGTLRLQVLAPLTLESHEAEDRASAA